MTVRFTVKNGDPSGAEKIWENRFCSKQMDLFLRYKVEKGLRAVYTGPKRQQIKKVAVQNYALLELITKRQNVVITPS